MIVVASIDLSLTDLLQLFIGWILRHPSHDFGMAELGLHSVGSHKLLINHIDTFDPEGLLALCG